MSKLNDEAFDLQNLEIQKLELLDRIQKLKSDLRCPLDMDLSEQAGQLSQQIVLRRLLQMERSNLRKLNLEIEKRSLAGLREA